MGEVDKALGALPIFFLVLLISAAFVALNAGVIAVKKAPDHLAVYNPVNLPILFDVVSLEVTAKKQDMTVLEAFSLIKSNPELFAKLKSEIVKQVPENECSAFLWVDLDANGASLDGSSYIDPSLVPHGFFSKNSDGATLVLNSSDTKSTEFYQNYKLYDSKGYLEKKSITFGTDKKRYNFMTYRGACPNA